MVDPQSLITQLLDPSAYPFETLSVDLEQTHISLVFLTGEFVYKVKRPVDFGFLDFTTLEKRLENCNREVILNRRLSPEVYLGVVPITQDESGLHVEGVGEPVEYAVKMSRLPKDGMMDRLLQKDAVTEEMMADLGRRIAQFHATAITNPEITEIGGADTVRVNVQENFDQTEAHIGRTLDQETWDAIREYSLGFLDRRAGVFQHRAETDRIRDCHGDLRAAQICFHDGEISILDCIEFNDRFRISDVAADIAFLAMDLDVIDRQDLSKALMTAYLDESQDWELLELLPFYQSYRAYVRGKIEGFRLDDPTTPEGEKAQIAAQGKTFFDLARSYAKQPITPRLVLMGGLMGTGKTTVAEALSHERGFAHLSSDETRKRLAGIDPEDRRYVEFDSDIYSPEFSQRTYQALFDEARDLLKSGRSVIVDASFRTKSERAIAVRIAEETGSPLLFALCTADDETIRQRLTDRETRGTGASDGRWEIYQAQKDHFEPPNELVPNVIELRTGEISPVVLSGILAVLDYQIQ